MIAIVVINLETKENSGQTERVLNLTRCAVKEDCPQTQDTRLGAKARGIESQGGMEMPGGGSGIHRPGTRRVSGSRHLDAVGHVSMTYNTMSDAKRSELIQWRTKRQSLIKQRQHKSNGGEKGIRQLTYLTTN